MNPHLRLPNPIPDPPACAGGYGADRYGVFFDLDFGTFIHRFRWIAPGEFLMGSPENEEGRYEDESPQHRVNIARGFWLGSTPVTQEFYQAIAGSNPSQFNDYPVQARTRPVEQVSWKDGHEFVDKLNTQIRHQAAGSRRQEAGDRVQEAMSNLNTDHFRMPTEAEWEYACRAGTTSAFNDGSACTEPTGKDPDLDRLGWYDENSNNTTHPVAEKLPNAWGLYDMHGNVWEWCADHLHGNYKDAPIDGSAWVDADAEKGALRVVRGGSWDRQARACRCACRSRNVPGARWVDLGFRLVLAPSSTNSLEPGKSAWMVEKGGA